MSSKSGFKYVPTGDIPGGNRGPLDTIEGILAPEFSRPKSIYEVLFEYYPQLRHDSSTWNLISQANTLFNDRKSAEVFLDYSEMFNQCILWIRTALNDEKSEKSPKSEMVKRLFQDKEKEELLEKMKTTFGGDKRFASFTKIDDFLDYAAENELEYTNNKFDEGLRNLIIQLGLAVTSAEVKKEMRRVATLAYVTDLGNILRAKYPNREKEKCPEWDRFSQIYEVVTSREAFAEYDEFLSKIDDEVGGHVQKVGQKVSIAARRDKIILGRIANGKPVYGGDPSKDVPLVGNLEWHIEEHKEPELLCDMFTTYTEDPQTNQRVIAVSYGKFYYDMGMFKSGFNPPEIIGVTRIGKDDVEHYFAVASLGKMSFRTTEDLKPGEKRMIFSANKKSARLVDTKDNMLYGVMSPKIPQEDAGDIVDVLFSDYHMRNTIELNSRYLGHIMPSKEEGKVNLIATDFSGFERVALKQAMSQSGLVRISVPGKTIEQAMTLEKYFGSGLLLDRQMQMASMVSNRQVDVNQDKAVGGEAK